MADKKAYPLALLEILSEYSDPEHPLSQSRLLELLETKYNLPAERRSIYANIAFLQEFGFQISTWQENHKGYYLISRPLDASEVLLLCNAVHASHFISQTQSRALINKLLHMMSRHQRKEYSDSVYLPNEAKTRQSELLKNIQTISKAVQKGRQIRFTYMQYNMQKQMVPRRQEPYVIEPHGILYQDSRPYVVATFPEGEGEFYHYRLDRMRNIHILDAAVQHPFNRDVYRYARSKFFSYTGPETSATLRCRSSILNAMIDYFGEDTPVHKDGEDHFILRVKGSTLGILILAQQYMDAMEIVDPAELRQTFRQRLRQAEKLYQDHKK